MVEEMEEQHEQTSRNIRQSALSLEEAKKLPQDIRSPDYPDDLPDTSHLHVDSGGLRFEVVGEE